jgi:4-alpha-glucanotransferase
MNRRGSGILLHITSLPSPFGIGDLGPWAYRFAELLSQTKQSFWQILPLNPTSAIWGNSPYSSPSAFAGNTILISPESLVEEGLLSRSDIEAPPRSAGNRVDYKSATKYKWRLFSIAYKNFKEKWEGNSEFGKFCSDNSHWLENYALFVALKEYFNGRAWDEWPIELRDREEKTIRELKEKLRDKIETEKFLQYIFFKQWFSIKTYCTGKNIQIIGDIPIYVSHDSSDVWANPEIFNLDEEKKPALVSGVPPDCFSKIGQLWGTPVYRWEVLKESEYSWWIKRIEHNLRLFDILRLDHFRGFVSYWEVPAGEKTAINGKWVEAPARDFFSALLKHFKRLPIIAEDLGVVTPDVKEIMNQFGFPGMRLLIFAFGSDFPKSSYLSHNHIENCLVYTGTHDNNTIRGWFRKEASPLDKERFFKYIGRRAREKEIHLEFIRLAMMSPANISIISMQDVLGLGEESRMNLPSTPRGNWQWRLIPDQITPLLTERLREMTETYGRA